MDKNKNLEEKTLLYFGINEKISAKKHWWQSFDLMAYRCQKKGKIREGRLTYLYCPVPEYYCGTGSWKEGRLRSKLQQVIERLQPDEYFLNPRVRRMLGAPEDGALPPMCLLEARLSEKGKFHSVSVFLPEEGGVEAEEVILHLLTPYLSKVNSFVMIGGEDWLYEELEDYLYAEYGIVANRVKRPEKGSLCLNLWSGDTETVKFLDTMVKNGYNTKVN